jgi:serine/threonine protein kinase
MTADAGSPNFPKIPGYRIDRELGRGGMGVVYQGVQEILQRPVAIKALIAEEGMLHTPDRFLNEARIMARMEPHENITQVHDVIRDESGRFYIVMEFVQGSSLGDYLTSGRMPNQTQALWVASKALRGLHHAHLHGIIHRDVKPDNIMLTSKGGVKVMDFGIARAEGVANKTQAGMALGTPDYMSPEQITLTRPIDARSDVYSMAVVLFYMVCGRLPYVDPNPYNVAMQHVKGTPPPPRSLNPAISPALEEAILAGMGKQPESRFPTAETFAMALDAVSAGVGYGAPDPRQSASGAGLAMYRTMANSAGAGAVSERRGVAAATPPPSPPPARQPPSYQPPSYQSAPYQSPPYQGSSSYQPPPPSDSGGMYVSGLHISTPAPTPSGFRAMPSQDRVEAPNFSREEGGGAGSGGYISGQFEAVFTASAQEASRQASGKPPLRQHPNAAPPYGLPERAPQENIYDSASHLLKFLVGIALVFLVVFFAMEKCSGSKTVSPLGDPDAARPGGLVGPSAP